MYQLLEKIRAGNWNLSQDELQALSAKPIVLQGTNAPLGIYQDIAGYYQDVMPEEALQEQLQLLTNLMVEGRKDDLFALIDDMDGKEQLSKVAAISILPSALAQGRIEIADQLFEELQKTHLSVKDVLFLGFGEDIALLRDAGNAEGMAWYLEKIETYFPDLPQRTDKELFQSFVADCFYSNPKMGEVVEAFAHRLDMPGREGISSDDLWQGLDDLDRGRLRVQDSAETERFIMGELVSRLDKEEMLPDTTLSSLFINAVNRGMIEHAETVRLYVQEVKGQEAAHRLVKGEGVPELEMERKYWVISTCAAFGETEGLSYILQKAVDGILDRNDKNDLFKEMVNATVQAVANQHTEAAELLLAVVSAYLPEKSEQQLLGSIIIREALQTGHNSAILQLCLEGPEHLREVMRAELPPHSRELIEQFEAGTLPKHELWQELGDGPARWEAVFNKKAPHPGLNTASPFKFSQAVYDDVLPRIEKIIEEENEWLEQQAIPAEAAAYNLAVLFSSPKEAQRYLNDAMGKWAKSGSSTPMLDAVDFELPIHGRWQVDNWKKLVLSEGPQATAFLVNAVEVEAKLAETGAAFPKRVAQVRNLAFARRAENPEMAEFAETNGVRRADFDKALDLLESASKTDRLPDIRIDGADIGQPDFYMEKLPKGDWRGPMLGKILRSSRCCQYIGGAGASCAEHGTVSENGGFYVWKQKTGGEQTKKDPIVAQSWAWIGKGGELVLDSFERALPEHNALVKPFLEAFAAEVQDVFPKVQLGYGGDTPRDLGYQEALAAEPRDHMGYGDSRRQYAVPPREKTIWRDRVSQPLSARVPGIG